MTKHIIVVFEASDARATHKAVYRELHTVIDRLSYDAYMLSGEIPKVNLISHSRGGITSMMYATGYREGSKIDKVEYSKSEQAGYIDIGDEMYEKEQSYSANGVLLYDHPFNVCELYSLGSPYKGTKLDQPWAHSLLSGSFNNASAKNITDETIQAEIESNWEYACSRNPQLKLYANAGEISLNFLIGLIGESRGEIKGYIENIKRGDDISVDQYINQLDDICFVLANEWIPTFQDVLQYVNAGCVAGMGVSILLPAPFSTISIITTSAILAASNALQQEAEYIKNQAIAFYETEAGNEPTDIEQKLLVLDGVLLHYYDFLNDFMEQILNLTSAYTGTNSVDDYGDLFISTDSQIAEGFSNVIAYTKTFAYEEIEINEVDDELEFSYNYRNFNINKRSINALSIPHNLETYDTDLQNRIRDVIRLERLEFMEHLDISLVSGSSTGNWKVKIKNNNSVTSTIIYNERMCFEGDAANFHHLTNLRSFKLSPGGERIVTITGNGMADYIAIAISYILPSGKSINIVSYANGLNASTLTMNKAKHNFVTMGSQGNVDLVPNYLNFQVVGKSGTTWNIKLINTNSETVSVTYNSKMCYDDAARNFYGLRDLVDIMIPANGYRTVNISENGVAWYITAAINYTVDGVRYRRVSSANGLTTSGGINQARHHEVVVASAFPETTSVPSYVSMIPVSRSGFIWYTWGIKITNHNSFAVEVSYNAKLCFEGDAKNFENLSDIVTIVIPANSSRTVTINHNGTAGWIVASLNYSYNGYEYRKITYADGLSNSPYGTNTPKYNIIRSS